MKMKTNTEDPSKLERGTEDWYYAMIYCPYDHDEWNWVVENYSHTADFKDEMLFNALRKNTAPSVKVVFIVRGRIDGASVIKEFDDMNNAQRFVNGNIKYDTWDYDNDRIYYYLGHDEVALIYNRFEIKKKFSERNKPLLNENTGSDQA